MPQSKIKLHWNEEDLYHLAWARYAANDDLARLCDIDWRANNLTAEQQRTVTLWLKLTELVKVP